MVIGTFLPAASFPLIGSMNLIGSGNRDGIILVALALLGMLFAFTARPWLLFSGLVSGAFMMYKLHALLQLDAGPFVQIDWGWLPMFAGTFLMLWVGFSSSRQPSADQQTT